MLRDHDPGWGGFWMLCLAKGQTGAIDAFNERLLNQKKYIDCSSLVVLRGILLTKLREGE